MRFRQLLTPFHRALQGIADGISVMFLGLGVVIGVAAVLAHEETLLPTWNLSVERQGASAADPAGRVIVTLDCAGGDFDQECSMKARTLVVASAAPPAAGAGVPVAPAAGKDGQFVVGLGNGPFRDDFSVSVVAAPSPDLPLEKVAEVPGIILHCEDASGARHCREQWDGLALLSTAIGSGLLAGMRVPENIADCLLRGFKNGESCDLIGRVGGQAERQRLSLRASR
ncbi:MAG: hypothetical protein HY778_03715 [Betaproteobacteria bacterium]|nr:hypothetical protein [Betaproteobacteria bacterium]